MTALNLLQHGSDRNQCHFFNPKSHSGTSCRGRDASAGVGVERRVSAAGFPGAEDDNRRSTAQAEAVFRGDSVFPECDSVPTERQEQSRLHCEA